MSVIHTLQPSFAGGEFAPSVSSRVDLQKYGTGLKTARNAMIHKHGGVSNRPGTRMVRATRFPDKKSRIVAFSFSITQSYAIEFGHLYCRLHTDAGTLLEVAKSITGATAANPVVITSVAHGFSTGDDVFITGVGGMTQLNGKQFQITVIDADHFSLNGVNGSGYSAFTSGGSVARIYTVATPYTESDLAKLKFTQSADTLYIVHPNYAPRTLTRFSDNPPNWQIALFAFQNGPFMNSNLDLTKTISASATTGSVTLTSSSALFDPLHVGTYFRLRHKIAGGLVVTGGLGANSITASVLCGTVWRLNTHGNWGGVLDLEKSVDGGTTWTRLRGFAGHWDGTRGDFNVNTFGNESSPCLIRLNFSAYEGGALFAEISSDPFDATGIVTITSVTDSTHAAATVVQNLCDNSATSDWAEGSWSDYRGYPSTVVFFEDRLCLGGSRSEPMTTWMSQTGSYADFGRSTPLVDSDGISVNLPSRQLNGINNLVGLQDILALTAATEWSIGPATGGTGVTPTSVEQTLHGYGGSSGVEPVLIGNRIIFIQPMGSVVRDLGYQFQTNGYSGDDLSIFANHLFTGYSIVEMAFQQEPDSIVWAVRSDGKLLSMTYVKEQEILAWTWHDTIGFFESICSIPSNGFNEIWMVVKRGNNRFVERMVQRGASLDPKQQFFVDCGLTLDQPFAITNVTSANPVVVTTASPHGFSNGDFVDLSDILKTILVDGVATPVSQNALNGVRFKVAGGTTNTFQLTDQTTGANIDGSAFEAYASGGNARKAVSVIAGLDHLNGSLVSILANGSVMPQQIVVNGQITLNPMASIVHVGLGYRTDIQTLNIEIKLQDGTLQDRRIKIPEVTYRFLNSRGGLIGPDADTLDELVQRTGEPLGSPMSLFTGDYIMSLAGSTYDRGGGSVLFRQEDPLPVTILSVMPKVTVGG